MKVPEGNFDNGQIIVPLNESFPQESESIKTPSPQEELIEILKSRACFQRKFPSSRGGQLNTSEKEDVENDSPTDNHEDRHNSNENIGIDIPKKKVNNDVEKEDVQKRDGENKDAEMEEDVEKENVRKMDGEYKDAEMENVGKENVQKLDDLFFGKDAGGFGDWYR
ncbi:hypothetical protein ACET3Z_027942 [Daucus carota]